MRRPTNVVYDREKILNIRTLRASNITGIRWHLDIIRKHRILTDTVTPCPQLPGGGSSRDGVDVNKVTEQLLSAPTLQEALSQLKMLHHQAAEQLPASSCQDAQ